ncbi:hypothetical protein LOD99_8676 [Oopsacas minuta]|uniref:Tyrosine-protein phosphatase domain-containing protein n=1 Tax=Oopsacas minuta TaxID=111878 RepID=A0AAV7JFQ3_9METZ|nr:hypothetical protein LOD99_8676 [Oopsacas minuta]
MSVHTTPFEAEISLTADQPPELPEHIKLAPKDLTYISDRLQLIEPTILYNLIQQYIQSNHDPNTLLIIDVRTSEQYIHDHILHSIWCGAIGEKSTFTIPYDIEFETLENLVVIDNSAVTNLDEHSIACKYGIAIAPRLKGKIMIVMGGYERFSAEYPFLRTEKVNYTSLELKSVHQLPSEVIPLLLYIGCQGMMRNVDINRDLKIKSHIFAFPKDDYTEQRGISYLHVNFNDVTDFNTLFNQCFDFIELYRHRAERTLIACPLSINESAVLACGYLMKRYRMSLLKAYSQVKKCLHSIRPNTSLIRALLEYEKTLFSDVTLYSNAKEVMRLVRLESSPFYL